VSGTAEDLDTADAGNLTITADAGADAGIAAVDETVRRRWRYARKAGLAALAVATAVIAGCAGYLKYEVSAAESAQRARGEAVQTAKDAAVAMLSYTPADVVDSLNAARERLTGAFRESYTSLINDVVIPGAEQKQITATATVPAAAWINASPDTAEVVLFVNQQIIVGDGAPSDTSSVVQVNLVKIDDRWLISGFEPK
jgi:Mce-associated membrane protein